MDAAIEQLTITPGSIVIVRSKDQLSEFCSTISEQLATRYDWHGLVINLPPDVDLSTLSIDEMRVIWLKIVEYGLLQEVAV
jgi:hypothetical protein